MENMIAKLLQDFERGKMSRRQLIQSLALTATMASAASAAPAAAADSTVAKAVSINHISYQVSDYTKIRDFYADLLGMKVTSDDGTQCRLRFGDSSIIARNQRSGTPLVDHISYNLANWDTDKNVKPAVEAELKRRGLRLLPTTGPSFNIKDPEGFLVQLGGTDQ